MKPEPLCTCLFNTPRRELGSIREALPSHTEGCHQEKPEFFALASKTVAFLNRTLSLFEKTDKE